MSLKKSKVFDNIFEEKMSIRQLMNNNPLAKHNYKVVSEQFEEVYKLIGI